MGKEYIPLFLDFNENTEHLSDEECGRLVRAIVDYANDLNYEKRLTGPEKIAFPFLKGLVDRNTAISEKRSKARANKNKTEQDIDKYNGEKQNETNDNKTEENESNSTTKTKTKTKNKNQNPNQNNSILFDRFWGSYPRHINKQGAMKAFEKAKIDSNLIDVILEAIERQKASDQWTKDGGQYIPHPATWINQKRWEDEIVPSVQRSEKKVSAQDYGQREYIGEQDEARRRMLEMGGETNAEEAHIPDS